MSIMRQIDLLPAGCQPWNVDVCAASSKRFAYCSTLAIYVYQYNPRFNEYKLESIMSEHRKTITTISWSPFDNDLFVSASADPRICVWDAKKQNLVASFTHTTAVPASIRWHPKEKSTISYICGRGPLQLVHIDSDTTSKPIDTTIFLSDVSHFCWNYHHGNKIAFGHVDGSISILWIGEKIDRHCLKPDFDETTTEDDPVIGLKWDELSSDYLLVANLNFGIRLIDTENMFVITKFQLPSAAARVSSIAWVPSVPGMFVTGDAQSGVLRIWNVSKITPVENIRLKKTGFHSICLVPRTKSRSPEQSLSWNSHISSTSIAKDPPTAPNSDPSVLPPADLLCTFTDGGVGLYNLDKRKWGFLQPMGHTETIFCCEFQPNNCDMLATASFDGTVKIWDVTTMEAVNLLAGNEGIIYSLTWAPGNLNCIACGTGKKGIFIWDVSKAIIICRYLEHGSNPVYCVSWNQKDSQLLASTCGAGLCVIRNVDGKVLQKYKHPSAVYGCEWSPNNRDMIATSCEDKHIRIFYIAASTDNPLRIFKGHTAKAFHVRWSPLRDGYLCSGSDDATVRLWDYSAEKECVGILKGHTGPVRGLLWNPEIPYLLLSGSWDYTIKIWDTRSLSCLETVVSHGADVYGLACHPHRPFVVASTSRDSTVRLWSLDRVVHSLSLAILAQRPSSQILAKNLGPSPQRAQDSWEYEHGLPYGFPGSMASRASNFLLLHDNDGLKSEFTPLLSGKYSKEIHFAGAVEDRSGYPFSPIKVSQLFSIPRGLRNFWDLIAVLSGNDVGVLSSSYSKGIVHIKHLVQLKASEAQELETVKMSSFAGIGSQKRNDKLKAAASIHVKIGEMQRYCELMIEVGEWDKALSFAPGVSLEYWKSLMERRANQLVNEGNDAAVPYCLATGNIGKLCKFFTSRGEFHDAVLVALASKVQNSTGDTKTQVAKGLDLRRNDVKQSKKTADKPLGRENTLLMESLTVLADWYFENNQPIIAACCHLAINDVQHALSKLLRCNELENAFALGRILDADGELQRTAAKCLSRRCEKLGRWDLAIDLLKFVDGFEDELWMLCARSSGTTKVIDQIHEKAAIPSLSECFQKAEELLKEQKYLNAFKYYLVSSTPELALDIGLNLVRDILLKDIWDIKDIYGILQYLGFIRTETLQSTKLSRQRHELLLVSAYIGALLAIQRKYIPVVALLFNHTRYLINKEKANLPVTGIQVEKENKAWLMYHDSSFQDDSEYPEDAEEIKKTWNDLKRRIGPNKSKLEEGVDIVVGSSLPNSSNAKPSFLTGQKIAGPVFVLEDGQSVISLNNALMWAKVNPFSPLATGEKINPF